MSDPQAPKGETDDQEEVDSSVDTAAERAALSGEHDAPGAERAQDPFDWPAEDPETTSEEEDEDSSGQAVSGSAEHEESVLESTQRLEAVDRVPEPHAERTSAGEEPDESAADQPTVQINLPPALGRETTSGEGLPADERRSDEPPQAAGSSVPKVTRPAAPTDFGMPSGGPSSGAPRLLSVAGATAASESAGGAETTTAPETESVTEEGTAPETSTGAPETGSPEVAAPTDERHADDSEGRELGIAETPSELPESTGAGDGSGSDEKQVRGRTSRKSLITVVSLAGVLALVAVAVLGGSTWLGDVLRPRADPPALVRVNPSVEGLASSARVPSEKGLSRALDGMASDPALGRFGGVVLDSRTGEVLWNRNGERAMVPASTNKLLTSCAALLAIDHDFRFSTKVVRGEDPGSIVLLGGGDPTLSALPAGQSSVYPGAARLDELVRKVRSTTSGEISSVKVDVSRYSGPTLAGAWDPKDVERGYVAPVRPVMLDGGRVDPKSKHSPREQHSALHAARELASRLGAPTESVSITTMRKSTSTIAEVRSPPLRDLVRKLLRDSDNVLAEAVARQVAVATGHEPSFSGAVRAVRSVLERHGFDMSGVHLVDGSGLSDTDKVPPKLLGELLRVASTPADGPSGRSARLRPVVTAVPVAGASGTLAGRYEGPASSARGWVRAKTGTLTEVNTLAGTVVTADGRLLSFAFLSNGSPAEVARPALDRLAAELRSCGCH